MALVNEMNVCELTLLPCAEWICGVVSLTRMMTSFLFPDDLIIGNDEVVVSDAVQHDGVEVDQLLDVFRSRLIVAGIDLAREDSPHLVSRQRADHVLRPRIVGMQRHADLQRRRDLR